METRRIHVHTALNIYVYVYKQELSSIFYFCLQFRRYIAFYAPPPQISFPQRGTKDIPLEGLAWKTNTSS